jgi:hypothetical protein
MGGIVSDGWLKIRVCGEFFGAGELPNLFFGGPQGVEKVGEWELVWTMPESNVHRKPESLGALEGGRATGSQLC